MYLPDVGSEEGGEEIRGERSGGGNHNYKGAAEAAEVCLRARKLAVTKPAFSSFVSLAVSTGECGCEYERRERAESRPTRTHHAPCHARAVLCMCHVYKALALVLVYLERRKIFMLWCFWGKKAHALGAPEANKVKI